MDETPGFDRFGRFINRRELDALAPALAAGERVLYAAEAHREGKGLLAATDRRILFLRVGWLRRRVRSWPYAQVAAVRLRLDVDDAVVTVTTKRAGDVAFARVPKRAAEAFAKAVKERPPAPGEMLDFQDARTPRQRTEQEQRLDRLDRMLERGTLTRAEHERARRAALEGDD